MQIAPVDVNSGPQSPMHQFAACQDALDQVIAGLKLISTLQFGVRLGCPRDWGDVSRAAHIVNSLVGIVNTALDGATATPAGTSRHFLILDEAEFEAIGILAEFHADDPMDTPYDHDALERIRLKLKQNGAAI